MEDGLTTSSGKGFGAGVTGAGTLGVDPAGIIGVTAAGTVGYGRDKLGDFVFATGALSLQAGMPSGRLSGSAASEAFAIPNGKTAEDYAGWGFFTGRTGYTGATFQSSLSDNPITDLQNPFSSPNKTVGASISSAKPSISIGYTYMVVSRPSAWVADDYTPTLTDPFGAPTGYKCFSADTFILASIGNQVTISTIRPGDNILAFDGFGALLPARVTRLLRNVTDEWLIVRPAPGQEAVAAANGFTELTVTPGHETLDAQGRFRPIIDILTTDARLVLADGSAITGQTTFTRANGTTGKVADATLAFCEMASPKQGLGQARKYH